MAKKGTPIQEETQDKSENETPKAERATRIVDPLLKARRDVQDAAEKVARSTIRVKEHNDNVADLEGKQAVYLKMLQDEQSLFNLTNDTSATTDTTGH